MGEYAYINVDIIKSFSLGIFCDGYMVNISFGILSISFVNADSKKLFSFNNHWRM